MMELLKAVDLKKSYPSFHLDSVSFTVEPGRIHGLIGKNGAGKSTTLKLLLNMVRRESGEVQMFGSDFFANEESCKQRIGVVFGGIDYYPLKRLSAIADVTRRFYPRWEEERYRRLLRLFELDERKKMKELSSGMKVKFLLALAMSRNAELLILDEPTSGLDPVSRDELLQIFEMLVREGRCGILFSTHITSDLDRCADDITYIHSGKVLQSAPRSIFLQSFDHLKKRGESALTLEEIMLRTERRDPHEMDDLIR